MAHCSSVGTSNDGGESSVVHQIQYDGACSHTWTYVKLIVFFFK